MVGYVAMETFSNHDWIHNFQMSKETFLYLFNQLRPRVIYKDTVLRGAVSVEKSCYNMMVHGH